MHYSVNCRTPWRTARKNGWLHARSDSEAFFAHNRSSALTALQSLRLEPVSIGSADTRRRSNPDAAWRIVAMRMGSADSGLRLPSIYRLRQSWHAHFPAVVILTGDRLAPDNHCRTPYRDGYVPLPHLFWTCSAKVCTLMPLFMQYVRSVLQVRPWDFFFCLSNSICQIMEQTACNRGYFTLSFQYVYFIRLTIYI